MVVFALLAFFGFRSDYKNQQKLMFSVVKNESSALSDAVTDEDGKYRVDYDKLGDEFGRYFNKDKLGDMRSDGKQTKQEFLVSVLESDAYSPVSTKTNVLSLISAGLLLWLVLRSFRQIRALF